MQSHAGHAEFVFSKRRVCTFASGWAKNLRESCANSNRLTGELHKHKAAFLYWVHKMYHYLRRPSLQKCVFYITRTTHFTSLSACQSSSHPFFCFLFLIWPPGAPTQNCWCERINPGIHQICFAESWAASNVKIRTLLHSWGVFCVELWHIFPRTSWHFTPSTWIFCKHEKSMTISWSVSPLPFGDQFVQFEWGFLHLLVFWSFLTMPRRCTACQIPPCSWPPLSATNTWDSSWWRLHLVGSWKAPEECSPCRWTEESHHVYGFIMMPNRLKPFSKPTQYLFKRENGAPLGNVPL